MRIFGFAFVLLGAFLSFASAQTPTADPSDTFLRSIKALADSGGASAPATVAVALHFSFSEIDHSVSSGTGQGGCPVGGNQAQRAYDVVYNTFGHEGRPVITITSKLGCDWATQNEATTITTIRPVPVTCISKAQIETVFPKLGPGDYVFLGGINNNWKSDFAYSTPGASVNFLITPHPFEPDIAMPPLRLPNGTYVSRPPPTPAPNDQSLCLIAMSLSGQSHIKPSHASDFRYRPPTSSRVGVISPSVSYQTPQTDPGIFLLRLVKAVADSGRTDDPDVVANVLHVSLTPNSYSNNIATSCSATPDFRNFASIHYSLSGNSWFRPLPTGKRVLKSGMRIIFGSFAPETIPIGNPIFNYGVIGQITCTRSSTDDVSTSIGFGSIPSYACISKAEIKLIFPGIQPAPNPDYWDWGADLRYSNTIPTPDEPGFVGTIVDFGMTSSLPGGVQPHQPVCLNEIDIHGHYHLGGVHKFDLGD